MSDIDLNAVPTAGGSYLRDDQTGELVKVDPNDIAVEIPVGAPEVIVTETPTNTEEA